MAAVWARARAELRRRWRATALLAVLVGLAGGLVLAAVAGARRTESAMGRFLAYNHPMDVFVIGEGPGYQAVRRLPQVEVAATRYYVALVPPSRAGAPDPAAFGSVNPWAPALGPLWTELDRPLVVAGRHPDPARPLEAAVNERLAREHRLRPGSTFTMWAYTPAQLAQSSATARPGPPQGPRLSFTVTAIERQPEHLSPIPLDTDVEYGGSQDLYLTPAFWRAYRGSVGAFDQPFLGMHLRRGRADFAAFSAAVRRLPGGDRAMIGIGSDSESVAAQAQRAIHLQAVALLLFAALAGLGSLLVVGQALARQVQLGAAEHATLRALGMTRAQVVAAALAPAALLGAAGALLAVLEAAALSPLSPMGLARQAEIHPGWSLDPPVLALGALAVLLAVLARAAASAWRASRALEPGDRALAGRPSRLAERLARAGAAPSTVTGVRMALDPGQGGGAVPVRAALVGATAAVVAVAASLTFAASLGRLVASPALQGWNWDVVVGSPHSGEDLGLRQLAANRLVRGFSPFAEGTQALRLDGVDVPAVGVDQVRGEVGPSLYEGRAPRAADEVALGRTTLRRLGRRVGDLVEVQGGGRRRALRVVGEALLSPPAFNDTGETTMGSGAVLTIAGLRAFLPDAIANRALVRYAPGADPAAAYASLRRDYGRTVLRPLPPEEVANLDRVSGLPLLLAALLALLGAATVGHALVTSTRRRRQELAVLKALGFVRRQLSATLAWQATTLALLALALGLPLGVAAGRWAWLAVARGLETPAGPVVPALAVLALVPAALALANATAAPPARAAARTRPAVVLRSE